MGDRLHQAATLQVERTQWEGIGAENSREAADEDPTASQCPKCGVMDLDGPRGPGTLWKSTTVSSESRDPPLSAKRETTSEEPLRRRRAGLMGSGGNNRSSVPCPRSPGWEKAEAGLKLAVPRYTLLCVRQWGARETVGGGETRQGRGGEQAGNVQKGVPAPEQRALGHQR